MTSATKAVNKTASSGFDSLPVFLQLLIGIFALLAIAVIGFAVFYAIDILLLDADPVGNLVSLIARSAK